MADTSPRFGGLVVASLAGVVGAKYILGGALATVDATEVGSVLVMGNIPITFAVGLLLGLVTGALVSGFILARPMAILLFLGVLTVSIPALQARDPIIVTESVGMGLAILYLVARNPIERVESTKVDDEDSATRYGSTLR